MGLKTWYNEVILSRFIRCACNSENIEEMRRHVVPLARGRVFELGCGGGANQKLYDASQISHFAAIDPSPALLDAAREAAQAKGWQADIRQGVGEAIPFADESFDTVVVTYTLCSVSDQAQALREMRRILKPGGQMLFLEHGRSPDARVSRTQKMIEPVWKRLMGNCHLTREVTGAVTAQGFALESGSSLYVDKMPRWAGWTEWGVAVKEG